MRVLRAKLAAHLKEQQAGEVARDRREQVGSGERSEKIRTYNIHQNRVTDHRLKESWHNVDEILEGRIGPILEALGAKRSSRRQAKYASRRPAEGRATGETP